jgi:hypothetical protein
VRLAAAVASCLALLTAAATAGAAAPARSVYHVGDSLAYGTSLYLPQYLKGWKLQQKVDVSMQSYSVPGYVTALGSSLPRVVIVSAGTNGSPAATSLFKADVRKVLRIAGPKRCVIWANVVRPPYQGVSYDGINQALADLDRHSRRLLVFDWAGMIRRNPGALSKDGVHVAVPFYKKRAQVLAGMAKRCALSLPS